MAGTPIEQLNLPVRASNVLHRMGVHTVEELIATPIEKIAQQRNMGVGTLNLIKDAIDRFSQGESLANRVESEAFGVSKYSEEQLAEMTHHSTIELGLSARPYHALMSTGKTSIALVANLSETDIAELKGLGQKSIEEIKSKTKEWIQENLGAMSEADAPNDYANEEITQGLHKVSLAIEPIFHLYWRDIGKIIEKTEIIEQNSNFNQDDIIMRVLSSSDTHHMLKAFWESSFPLGIISNNQMMERISHMELSFCPDILIKASINNSVLSVYHGAYLIVRDKFSDAYGKLCDPYSRAARILKNKIDGRSLQEIGDNYGLTRERVRQITVKAVRKFPLLYEDYFCQPYQFFRFPKDVFIRAFPGMSSDGYEYLSIRYQRGKVDFTPNNLAEYHGAWKDLLSSFIQEEHLNAEKRTVSRAEMAMRVLILNADEPLTMGEFEERYYDYISSKGYPLERLRINPRSIVNHLRNAKRVVFNRENKVRFCDASPQEIWENIDFTEYKNSVISSELLFRDYSELMSQLDIRDGYELFYVIKSSLDVWGQRSPKIKCRRVPTIVIGIASEESQALSLLKEISPVAYLDYYEAYEERYGVRRESAQGNPVISNAVGNYYVDGHYIIDAPAIDDRDIPVFTSALAQKPIWFIKEIEELFDKVCLHSKHDAINASAFKRIGYSLHAAYAYNTSYGSVSNLFDKIVFSQDVLDLSSLDRRILGLSMFKSILDKKKNELSYIETAPQVLMSIKKIRELYDLSYEDILELQEQLTPYYEQPFFNGHSIWNEVESHPQIRKLNGNDWMLTCIMRQQWKICSFPVAGGIILSLNGDSLSLSNICKWLVSQYGRMSLSVLEREFNDKFGTRIPASKFAEKLKSSGIWDTIVTDSMDEYIDGLMDADFQDISDDLFKEEFF